MYTVSDRRLERTVVRRPETSCVRPVLLRKPNLLQADKLIKILYKIITNLLVKKVADLYFFSIRIHFSINIMRP